MNIIERNTKIFVKRDWYKNTRDYKHSKIKIPEHSLVYSGNYPIKLRVIMCIEKEEK